MSRSAEHRICSRQFVTNEVSSFSLPAMVYRSAVAQNLSPKPMFSLKCSNIFLVASPYLQQALCLGSAKAIFLLYIAQHDARDMAAPKISL